MVSYYSLCFEGGNSLLGKTLCLYSSLALKPDYLYLNSEYEVFISQVQHITKYHNGRLESVFRECKYVTVKKHKG